MGKQKEVILDGLSPNQREAAETLDRDVLVRAGAGSGKTKTLVARYLLLLDENQNMPALLVALLALPDKYPLRLSLSLRQCNFSQG